MKRKLILVGAGPGAADLITVRGAEVLKNAGVVLYDALVDDQILALIPANAIKIFVGKRGGRPSFTQERINQLIVSYAAVYGEVVRLKGGDPFVFGRGMEELTFAQKNGVSTEVVPGISSATGLTALNGISLTQRGIADGFWVITATKEKGAFNTDLKLAAQSKATVVILMGVKKLRKIVDSFQAFGHQDTPVMIVQNGSLPNEKVVVSDLNNVISDAILSGVKAPAIIVIGETIRTNQHAILPELVNLN